jgi:hypothetical protein
LFPSQWSRYATDFFANCHTPHQLMWGVTIWKEICGEAERFGEILYFLPNIFSVKPTPLLGSFVAINLVNQSKLKSNLAHDVVNSVYSVGRIRTIRRRGSVS